MGNISPMNDHQKDQIGQLAKGKEDLYGLKQEVLDKLGQFFDD